MRGGVWGPRSTAYIPVAPYEDMASAAFPARMLQYESPSIVADLTDPS